MDIKTNKNPTGKKTFSEDILKIEKCGPNEDYLTIIDVPGIFRITTEGVTTNKDKDLVIEMVKRYIRDDRTIILAVLPCNVDVVTQEILALAEDSDKTGERTLGILTKPDLLKERSAKLSVCNLVEGKRKPLKLGYYVVRNRGGDDDDDANDTASALHEREAIFREAPWSRLPEDRIGVNALRERLEDLLGQITDRAFPQLRADTRKQLEAAEKELNELGPPRLTEREQQLYLTDIAGKFQNLVRAALDADYSAHPAFEKNELRLITDVVNITEQFNTDFENLSRTYLFESETEVGAEPYVEGHMLPHAFESPQLPTPEPESDHDPDKSSISEVSDIDIPDVDMFPDLEKIVVSEWFTEPPKHGILDWIESLHRRSRGAELGTFGQGILSSVFREQSAKWGSMSKQYLSKIILVVHRFVLTTLEVICTDVKVREEISSAIFCDLLAKYDTGMRRATFLVDVERNLKPYTLNEQFYHNHQKSRGTRVKETLKIHAGKEANPQLSSRSFNLNSITAAVVEMSNVTYTRENIHDILEAYYQVACKRFVDNLFSQAVDYELLSGPDSPLRLFCEQWVLQLDTERLLSIAGESRRTRDRRQRLNKKVQDLGEAMQILR